MKKLNKANQNPYYCGPFYMPMCIRKKLSKDFNLMCKQHDVGYNLQEKTRKEVDDQFLAEMLEQVANGHGTEKRARLYYFIVRYVIGWQSWQMIRISKKLGLVKFDK